MEGASVLSPSSWEKRRAWARQSRCWRTTVVEEEAAAILQDIPELQPPHLDDVFLEGSTSSKIETWLQECRSSMEVQPEELGLPGPYGCSSNVTSFEDDLTLGAEALLLPGSNKVTGSRAQHLTLGHSMASSGLSSLTTKTSSSISEVLEWWQVDAEEILYNLGFVQSEPGAVSRVPPRFFSAPSRANGIDFQLFLKAQVRRMEMEDPCLMLASRFQQVQALAATADAFFCLYSYVSRTPLQRISPAPLPVPDGRVPPAQPDTPSPVERLKKAVSTMCLYTSPRDQGSPPRDAGRGPTARPSALGKVVQEVLERAREEKLVSDPSSVPPARERAGDVPPCSHHGVVGAPGCSGGEREPSLGSAPEGTPEGTLLEWSWPRGHGDSPAGGAQGAAGAPCPVASGRVRTEERPDTAGSVPLSPTPGAQAPRSSRVWVTVEPPGGLWYEGDSGSCGSPPRRKKGSHGCHPNDPAGAPSPASDTPRSGSHRAQQRWGQRRRGVARRNLGQQKGLQPPRKDPSPQQEPADSFELEEVLSASEEEDGDAADAAADARDKSIQSLHLSVTTRRSFMLHASSGQSDSSGFMEEPVPSDPTTAPLCGTDQPA